MITVEATSQSEPRKKLIALVRRPGPRLGEGERTHIDRVPVDVDCALEQHARYVAALEESGAEVIFVSPAPQQPDAVFVEDTALVLDPFAVVANPGAESRRPEVPAVAQAISRYRHLVQLPPGATLDGGDILVIGSTVYVGLSSRTNAAAAEYLKTLLRPYACSVVPLEVTECLHLKSAVTWLGYDTVLINPAWISRDAFCHHRHIEVDPTEPPAANALLVGSHLFLSASFPRTAARVEALGFSARLLDVSEFHRAEGALTCLSILVSTTGRV